MFTKAWEQYQDESGWANIAPVGSFLKRATPDFDPRAYGATKLPQILKQLDSFFELTKVKGRAVSISLLIGHAFE